MIVTTGPGSADSINHGSYVPVYVQLAGLLRAQIDSGKLGPGDPIPSETTLMQRYGIGRVAVREAMKVLRAEGRIDTKRRVGSYVREEVVRRRMRIDGPVEIVTRMPTSEERQELGLAEGVPVFVLERPGENPEVLPGDRVRLVLEQVGE